MINYTESSSNYDDLEKKSTIEILSEINFEDQKVALAVKEVLPQIALLSDAILESLKKGGRLFYIGAGTSGRLGVLDASECPPTYGVSPGLVIGIIAGGDNALRHPVEFAEDSQTQAWADLSSYGIDKTDFLVGIAASGKTPYVLHGIKAAKSSGIKTGCITCNQGSPIGLEADFPIEVVVGPEYVTGSTRMKAGTAQKLILNMLTTSVMIKMGRVQGNRMVDMQISNDKLVDRGSKIVAEKTGLSYQDAKELLLKEGSVRKATEIYFDNFNK